jgi:hypothetical protein
MKTSFSRLSPGKRDPQQHGHYRFLLRFDAVDPVIASVQMVNMSLAALLMALVE